MAANILEITFAKAKNDLSGNYARAIILCDTAADLPAVNAFTNYELIQGSEAIVIDENVKYMMDSGGNWYISGDTFTDVYTKQQIDTLLQAKQDEIETKATVADIYGFGTVIPSNSDFNDYKTPGVYRVESNSIAATISNVPNAGAGRLEVKGLHAANRYIQIYYSGDGEYRRRWGGTSWYTWYRIEQTAVT